MNLDDGIIYYTIKSMDEWGKFMEGTLGDQGPKSDLGEQEIYTFYLSQHRSHNIENL
jgi:hypothetical protein